MVETYVAASSQFSQAEADHEQATVAKPQKPSSSALAATYAAFAQFDAKARGNGNATGNVSASSTCSANTYRPSGMLAAGNEATRHLLFATVAREACAAGVPAGLLDALIIHESRYQVDAVSPKGAVGLTQLMPGTATRLGVNAWSIADNIRGGARYLASMIASFGQYHLALAAYNAGPGAVTRSGGVPPFRETQAYVGDVIRRWSALARN